MSLYKIKPILYLERDVERLHRSYAVDANGCWLWKLTLNDAGYESMGIRVNGVSSTFRAHRVAYTMLVGPIPEGLVIDHLCKNRHCVNPEHLEPVTQLENIRRGHVGESDYAEQCKWLHGNSARGYRTNGVSYCRKCAVARQRAHRLGITTKEAVIRGDELDVTLTRRKPRALTLVKEPRVTLDWTSPRTCLDCTSPIRRRQDPKEKGVLLHAGRGKCAKCLKSTLYGEKYNTTAYHVDNPAETT